LLALDWHEQGKPTPLQAAINSGSLETAMAAARRTRYVPLGDAARIVVMARQRGQYELYSRMAVRWVARFIAEYNPSIEDLRTAVWALDQQRGNPAVLEPLLQKLVAYRRQ
jgi:hypothetical protein